MAFGTDVARIGGVEQTDQWIRLGDKELCGKIGVLRKILQFHHDRGDKVKLVCSLWFSLWYLRLNVMFRM